MRHKTSHYIRYNLEFPYTCKICNKEIKSKSGLGSHIKNQHKSFTYNSYLLKYENIDIKAIEKEWLAEADKRKQKQLAGLKAYQKSGAKRSPKKRMTKEQYNNWRNSMSSVFSLDWFINKYGEELGQQKYNERSLRISKQIKGNNFCNKSSVQYSKISQELFWEVYNRIKFNEVYFAELNHEYGCGTNQNFDFVVVDNKKIVEFNGDKWHANPSIYEENDIPMPGFIDKKAKQIWKEDMLKNNKAIKNGFEVLIIWEKEYIKNKEKSICKILNFLYN